MHVESIILCASSIFVAAKSLLDFIRATAKEFQDANDANVTKTARPALVKREVEVAGRAVPGCSKATSSREEEEVSLEKRKAKKNNMDN